MANLLALPIRRPVSVRQERLVLEPSACLPLVRERDGAPLGIMASFDIACQHASALARLEAQHRTEESA